MHLPKSENQSQNLPSLQHEEHVKVTYVETILGNKTFSIPVKILESGGWRDGYMGTINGTKASSEEGPEFSIVKNIGRDRIMGCWTSNMLTIKGSRWEYNSHFSKVSVIRFKLVNYHHQRSQYSLQVGNCPIRLLKSLSSMTDRYTSDWHIEINCQLFLMCNIFRITMVHLPQLSDQSMENLLMDSKFSVNALWMTM